MPKPRPNHALTAPVADLPQILIYQTEKGATRIEVNIDGETVWLSQSQMAELFDTSKQNVSLHIQNVFEEGELEAQATVKDSLTVQTEGQRRVNRTVQVYNLDVIISVGYRVKSLQGTKFRTRGTWRLDFEAPGFLRSPCAGAPQSRLSTCIGTFLRTDGKPGLRCEGGWVDRGAPSLEAQA